MLYLPPPPPAQVAAPIVSVQEGPLRCEKAQVAPRRGTLARCRHCGQVRRMRSRAMCRVCYEHHPEAREQYAPTHPRGHRGPGQGGRWRKRALPAEPTSAPPGSDEKIRILGERLALGVELHHPLDVKIKVARGGKISGTVYHCRSASSRMAYLQAAEATRDAMPVAG